MPNNILIQQPPPFSATATALQSHLAGQTFMDDLTKDYERDQRTHFDTRLETSLATSQHDLTTHVTDLRNDQTAIITDIQRIRNDMSNQQAMGTVVQNLDTVIRQFLSTYQSPPTPQPAASPYNLISRRCANRYSQMA